MIRKYLRVWWRMSQMSLMNQFSTKMASLGFLVGKVARLGFFLVFIVAIFRHTKSLAGYSLAQTVLFFLTFNLVDIAAQFLFRGIYSVRTIVVGGDLDYYLTQPVHPLYRIALHMNDFLDLFSLVPVVALLVYTAAKLGGVTATGAALYAALVLNGVVLALAMHVAAASVAVWTQELENTIWIYRDLMTFGRFPVDIYAAPLRFLLTAVVPIAVMVSFPARALLGTLSPAWTVYAFLWSGAALAASLAFWEFAVARYTSVSS